MPMLKKKRIFGKGRKKRFWRRIIRPPVPSSLLPFHTSKKKGAGVDTLCIYVYRDLNARLKLQSLSTINVMYTRDLNDGSRLSRKCWMPWYVIFRNEIMIVLTPSTSGGGEWGWWSWSHFSLWKTLSTNPKY